MVGKNNSVKPLRNSGRYVFGDVRKTTILDNAFSNDMRPVSEMMYSKKFKRRQSLIIAAAMLMPAIAFCIMIYIFITR